MMWLTALAVVFACGCTKPDDSNNGGNGGNNGGSNNSGGTYNGHAYVDLGLPSGTLWATCNVGADTPEDFGDKFAWGETSPKDTYNWITYVHCYSNYRELTKYCPKSNYGLWGYTDTLTILQPEDDAATANWGNGWCMPTKEQWEELKANTNSRWTSQNDVYGRVFAGNGQSLFLPAAHINSWDGWSEEIRYWSSSLGGSPECADEFYYGDGNPGIYGSNRCYGESVRPVRSTNNSSGGNNGGGNNGGEAPSSYTISTYANPTDGGAITGAGTYQQGVSCTLTATANNGYTFTNWTENGTIVSTNTNYTFDVTANRTLVANFTINLLEVTNFEWYRQANIQIGLEEYGLYWEGNAKLPHAQIKPLDGVTLYSFDNSSWNATNTDDEKTALFANSGQIITVYNNVSVNNYNSSYDDVIGTKMADGTLHLIHVTNCVVESGTPYFSYYIYGQSK